MYLRKSWQFLTIYASSIRSTFIVNILYPSEPYNNWLYRLYQHNFRYYGRANISETGVSRPALILYKIYHIYYGYTYRNKGQQILFWISLLCQVHNLFFFYYYYYYSDPIQLSWHINHSIFLHEFTAGHFAIVFLVLFENTFFFSIFFFFNHVYILHILYCTEYCRLY